MKLLSLLLPLSVVLVFFTTAILTIGGALTRAFHIQQSTPIYITLVVSIVVLMTSMISIRFFDTAIVRVIYTIATLAAGFLLYLLATAVIYWIVVGIMTLMGRAMPGILSHLLIIIPLLLGTIGIIQSFTITTTHYSVATNSATTDLAGKTVVVVSDIHLGPINRAGFLRRVVDRVIAQQPDLVLIPGDVFDGSRLPLAPVTAEFARLTAATPTVFAPGNHEGYGPRADFLTSLTDAGITVLSDTSTTATGITIIGFDYYRNNPESIARMESVLDSEVIRPTIALTHEPIARDILAQRGLGLVVSGHTHRGQFWPLEYIARAVYGPLTYGLTQYGNLTSITTNGVGTAVTKMRTFNTPEIVVVNFE